MIASSLFVFDRIDIFRSTSNNRLVFTYVVSEHKLDLVGTSDVLTSGGGGNLELSGDFNSQST